MYRNFIKKIAKILLFSGIVLGMTTVMAEHQFLEKRIKENKKNSISLLFLQQAQTANTKMSTPNCYELVLNNIGHNALYFSDEPNRLVGHVTYERFMKLWAENNIQPNAVLDGEYLVAGKPQTLNFVGTLSKPQYNAKQHTLQYVICVTDVNTEKTLLPAQLTKVNLFIDPLSGGQWG